MLIVREAFFGTRRFEGFQQNLAILFAQHSGRSAGSKLCQNTTERVPIHEGARRQGVPLLTKGQRFVSHINCIDAMGRPMGVCEGEEPFLFTESVGDPTAASARARRQPAQASEVRIALDRASEQDQQRVREMDAAENSQADDMNDQPQSSADSETPCPVGDPQCEWLDEVIKSMQPDNRA